MRAFAVQAYVFDAQVYVYMCASALCACTHMFNTRASFCSSMHLCISMSAASKACQQLVSMSASKKAFVRVCIYACCCAHVCTVVGIFVLVKHVSS